MQHSPSTYEHFRATELHTTSWIPTTEKSTSHAKDIATTNDQLLVATFVACSTTKKSSV
jgi:hypothetical protein